MEFRFIEISTRISVHKVEEVPFLLHELLGNAVFKKKLKVFPIGILFFFYKKWLQENKRIVSA